MVRLTVEYPVAFDLRDVDLGTLLHGYPVRATSREIVLDYGDGQRDYFSGSFRYWDDTLVSGTLTGYVGVVGRTRIVSALDLEVSVARLVDAAETPSRSDDRALIERAFAGDDILVGNRLGDRLEGFAGRDILRGGRGNDDLFGGRGRDVIDGGAGADRLWGGSDADVFDFNAASDSAPSTRDRIRDFARGLDRIDVSGIDADTDGTSGNQAFRFIGAQAFGGMDGQLRYAKGVLSGDTNGDRHADFAVLIDHVVGISAADFAL